LESNSKFSPQNCQDDYLEILLDRLKAVSQMRMSAFRYPGGNVKALRSHAIDFSETSEPNGFAAIPKPHWDTKQWQFELSLKNGRIHGFIDGNVFNVVWIDPDHELYKKK
jgi:hypothetical protein